MVANCQSDTYPQDTLGPPAHTGQSVFDEDFIVSNEGCLIPKGRVYLMVALLHRCISLPCKISLCQCM